MRLTPESLQEFARENSYVINMKTFGHINGYPNFAFYYDEKTKKYAIGNTKKFTGTEPFCDEILYSELPLETWTANYVVVRIDKKYYLCDNEGNCLWEQSNPFIICRNVFVAYTEPYKYFVINKYMKRCEFDRFSSGRSLKVLTTESGYNIAYLDKLDTEPYPAYLINSEGEKVSFTEKTDEYKLELSKIDCWAVSIKKLKTDGVLRPWDGKSTIYYLDKNFNIAISIYAVLYDIKLIGENSKTYTGGYSILFEAGVNFRKYGNVEVIWYDGKTYFYKTNGEYDVINGNVDNIRFIVDGILYYDSQNVYLRDKDGNLKSTTRLEAKDIYMLEMLREISIKENN